MPWGSAAAGAIWAAAAAQINQPMKRPGDDQSAWLGARPLLRAPAVCCNPSLDSSRNDLRLHVPAGTTELGYATTLGASTITEIAAAIAPERLKNRLRMRISLSDS